jgi:hypothetical protein
MNRVAYLESWLIEYTPHAIDVEHDLPLADVDLTILRNDLPMMSGDEVDLLSILKVEFLLEIPMMFELRF